MADETLDPADDTSDQTTNTPEEQQTAQVTDTTAPKPPRVGAIPDSIVFVQPPPVT